MAWEDLETAERTFAAHAGAVPAHVVETLRADARAWLRLLRDRQSTGTGCWEWAGARAHGYGQVRHGGRLWRVPRLAWTSTVGPLAPGTVVMHTCDNPACFNPAHLIEGTHHD